MFLFLRSGDAGACGVQKFLDASLFGNLTTSQHPENTFSGVNDAIGKGGLELTN